MNEKGKGGIKGGGGGIPFEKAIQLPEPPVPEQMHSTTFPQLEFSSFSSCLDGWNVQSCLYMVSNAFQWVFVWLFPFFVLFLEMFVVKFVSLRLNIIA